MTDPAGDNEQFGNPTDSFHLNSAPSGRWTRRPCPTCGTMAEVQMTGESHINERWRPPVFIPPNGGPFVVREEPRLPGDRYHFVAIDPSTGITPGGNEHREQAVSDQQALNAAYWLGSSHESHRAGNVVMQARRFCAEPASMDALAELVRAMKQYDGGEE